MKTLTTRKTKNPTDTNRANSPVPGNMASGKAASRYAASDSQSSFSSSRELDSFGTAELGKFPSRISSRALARVNSYGVPSATPAKAKNEHNFVSLVKRFMEKKPKPLKAVGTPVTLTIPADIIAGDLKKTAAKASRVSNLHRKFFQKASDNRPQTKKALPEGKENTRTLAMVLKSERDLLCTNKEYEMEIDALKAMMTEKNDELDKLKGLCLRQREEIRALKASILFPELSTVQLQKLLEKQGVELKHAREVIPNLQEQVSSLTDQIQCLAEGLAEVRADKHRGRSDSEGTPSWSTTPVSNQESANSLEFSSGPSGEPTSPGSPDDMILRDMNPCLTPYYAKSKSQDYDKIVGYGAPHDYFDKKSKQKQDVDMPCGRLSMSPEYPKRLSLGGFTHVTSKSDGTKSPFGKPISHKLL